MDYSYESLLEKIEEVNMRLEDLMNEQDPETIERDT